MRRILGLLLAGVIAACSSFTVEGAGIAADGDAGTTADAGADLPPEAGPDAATFCGSAPGDLCADFETDPGARGWRAEPSITSAGGAPDGMVAPTEAPERAGTRALHTTLTAKGAGVGATMLLYTPTLRTSVHVEVDVYIAPPADPFGDPVTLVSLVRDQLNGFLVEANLSVRDSAPLLWLYAETLGGAQGGSGDRLDQAFPVAFGRWYRIRLGADLIGTGSGAARLVLLEPAVREQTIDLGRVPGPVVETVETGLGLWRETGSSRGTLEAYFDNVVEGPGL